MTKLLIAKVDNSKKKIYCYIICTAVPYKFSTI